MSDATAAVGSAKKKLAVVTGGTRGIGGAITAQLLDEGYDCIYTGTADEPSRAAGGVGEYHQLELASRASTERFATYLADRKPDILVNNAGINIKGHTDSFEMSDFDKMLDVNLRGPFELLRAVLPGMLASEWGRVVNITSLWGVSGNREDAAYCASKFGLDGLTASVAAEVAREGVLINAVAPGYILTEAAREAFSPEDLATVSGQIPVGRLGRPEEVAELVAWLVSPRNTYVTGQNILIDGGLTRTAMP